MNMSENQAFRNAIIWRGNPITRTTGGMTTSGGRITGMFENGQEAPLPGEAFDLEGMHIIPGLIDAHRHFYISALIARHRYAHQWKSKRDALDAIEEACAGQSQPGGWVFFSSMDHTKWKNPTLPTHQEINEAAKGLPVLVADMSMHRALISSEAARKAGLKKACLRHAGDVDTFMNGKLKGTIWEEAFGMVLLTMIRDMFRECDEGLMREIIVAEADKCLAMGLTHVHDPGLPSDFQALLKGAQAATPLKLSWSMTRDEGVFSPPGAHEEALFLPSVHAPKSVKFFLDGAHRSAASIPVSAGLKALLKAGMESVASKSIAPLRLFLSQKIVLRDGRLTLPYLRFPDKDDLVRKASFFSDRGYRVVIHALGNIAAAQAAQAVKILAPTAGASIEHAMFLDQAIVDSLAESGAVVSAQPGMIPHYAGIIERMGVVGSLKTCALKSLLDRGVPVCISSDSPCGADDPIVNMRRAVDRRKFDGATLDADEAIGREEALAAATIGGSLSLGNRNDGLCLGAPATFCVVDGDPFSDSSRVVQTWIDGVRVY